MLSDITLKFTDSPELKIPVNGVTIFVGPNNSGKSLILREIDSQFNLSPPPENSKILKDYSVIYPNEDEYERIISRFDYLQLGNPSAGQMRVGRVSPSGDRETQEISKELLYSIAFGQRTKESYSHWLLRWFMLRLDGRSRFNLTMDRVGGDLTAAPSNILSIIFGNDELRKSIRSIIYDAFGLYFTIDPTNLGNLRIRLSEIPPLSDEQSLNADARAFHSDALHIQDASDGVQAFTGIVAAVFAGEYDTILIDEPEAFLHPPLAKKLGRHLAVRVAARGGALLASTHSPDFLMGCVQASPEVRVVRLEYANGRSRGKIVEAAELNNLLRSPLMRSSNVVSGLFHDGVIVTESDNDRVFYSEIYHRLAEANQNFPSVLFVNAQNKQTMRDIMGPLRAFGVPVAAIPDIDIVKDGGSDWGQWLAAGRLPSAFATAYGTQRAQVKALLEGTGKNMKLDGGVTLLSGADALAAKTFFDMLAEYGIFAVRNGEVENWLPALQVSGKKTSWTLAMLDRLGSDPRDSKYVLPGADDVWKFISEIVAWIKDPSRKGMV